MMTTIDIEQLTQVVGGGKVRMDPGQTEDPYAKARDGQRDLDRADLGGKTKKAVQTVAPYAASGIGSVIGQRVGGTFGSGVGGAIGYDLGKKLTGQ